MFRKNQITTVLKAYNNEKLNASKMKNILSMILPGQTLSEVSVKRLCKLSNIDLDSSYYSYRYDFVDYGHRVIYEFDGDQHFNFTPYFHETYGSFVKQHNRDIIKQLIAKKLMFDIVRITGNLTCKEFIDLLVKSNRRVGQSMFMIDNNYQLVNIELLEDNATFDNHHEDIF